MASNDDAITYFIDRDGVKSDRDFIVSALNDVYQGYLKIQGIKIDLSGLSNSGAIDKTLKQATVQSDALARSTQTVTTRMATLNGQTKEFTQALLTQTKAEKEAANADLIRAKTTNENIKAQAAKQKQSEQSEKALKAEQKAAADASNDYKQLSLAYNEAALRAKNLVLRLGEQHPVAKEAVNDARALHDQLLRLDQSVGQSQRNVGNYNGILGTLSKTLKGFGGLGKIISEAVGIDPGITQGVIEAGRAVKDLQHAKEIENLTEAEGTAVKEAGTVATQKAGLAQRAYNFIVGESTGVMKAFRIALAGIGIGVIIFLITELVANWKKLFGAQDEVARGMKNLKGVTNETKESLKGYGDTIQKITEGVLKDLQEGTKKVNDELGRTPSLLDKSNAALQLNENQLKDLTTAYKDAAGNNAITGFFKSLITPGSLEIQATLNDQIKETRKNLSDLTTEQQKFKTLSDLLRAQQSNRAHENSDLEGFKIREQLQIDANERILNNDRSTEAERIAALESSFAARRRIIQDNLKQELNDADGNKMKENEANRKVFAENIKNEKDTQEQIQKVRDEFAQRHIQAEFTIKELELQNEINLSKEIFENEKASFGDRFQALQTFLTRTKRLNDLAAAAQKSKLGLTAEEKDVIDAQAAFKTGDAIDFVNKKLQELIEKQKEQYLVHTPNMAKAWEDAADRINKKSRNKLMLFWKLRKTDKKHREKHKRNMRKGLMIKRNWKRSSLMN
jgi:hypothetical protein